MILQMEMNLYMWKIAELWHSFVEGFLFVIISDCSKLFNKLDFHLKRVHYLFVNIT